MRKTPLKRGTKTLKRSAFKKQLYVPATKIKKKKIIKVGRIVGKKKTITPAKLKKMLDSVFSQYIRRSYADQEGMVACYTCGKVKNWKEIQNGHFVSRQYLATRWDENNCRPQCVGCNMFGQGKPLDFEERLKKDLGEEYVETMKMKRHETLKLGKSWYVSEIRKYTHLLSELTL